MVTRSTTLGDETDDRMTDDVNYPDEHVSDWIRDAVRLRLFLENDRDMIAEISDDGSE